MDAIYTHDRQVHFYCTPAWIITWYIVDDFGNSIETDLDNSESYYAAESYYKETVL